MEHLGFFRYFYVHNYYIESLKYKLYFIVIKLDFNFNPYVVIIPFLQWLEIQSSVFLKPAYFLAPLVAKQSKNTSERDRILKIVPCFLRLKQSKGWCKGMDIIILTE